MFESNSIVVVTLRQRRALQTITTWARLLPQLAASNDASPRGWAQNWAHPFSDAANHSRISTFRGLPSLPWAQGVAGLPAAAACEPRFPRLSARPESSPADSRPPDLPSASARSALRSRRRWSARGSSTACRYRRRPEASAGEDSVHHSARAAPHLRDALASGRRRYLQAVEDPRALQRRSDGSALCAPAQGGSGSRKPTGQDSSRAERRRERREDAASTRVKRCGDVSNDLDCRSHATTAQSKRRRRSNAFCRCLPSATPRRNVGGPRIGPTNSWTLQIVRATALRKVSPACLGRRGSVAPVRIRPRAHFSNL